MNANTDLKLKKDTLFNARINARIKKAFAEMAKEEGITMSKFFEKMILREMSSRNKKLTIKKELI